MRNQILRDHKIRNNFYFSCLKNVNVIILKSKISIAKLIVDAEIKLFPSSIEYLKKDRRILKLVYNPKYLILIKIR